MMRMEKSGWWQVRALNTQALNEEGRLVVTILLMKEEGH